MNNSLFSSGGLDPDAVEPAREELRARLPELRGLPGFPIGSDEDILRMSMPPYYTACPNPFIAQWLEETKPDGYDRRKYQNPGPFAADITEGKSDLTYKAHNYWTKVPHKAIMRYILHYTEPGDVVLDGFCGSGMTGAAAQACGYPEEDFRREVESEMVNVQWGARRVILQDLAPAATFIAAGLNIPVNPLAFDQASAELMKDFETECGWMYQNGELDGTIDYMIWSEVLSCSRCSDAIVFFDAAFDELSMKVSDEYKCGSCGAVQTKQSSNRRYEVVKDALGDTVEQLAWRPVRKQFRAAGSKQVRAIDGADLSLLRRVEGIAVEHWYPDHVVPYHYRMMWLRPQKLASDGKTRAFHFYTKRALRSLSWLWSSANRNEDPILSFGLKFWVEQAFWGMTLMNRYVPTHFSHVNQYLSGVYYVSSLHAEPHPATILVGTRPSTGKRATLTRLFKEPWRHGEIAISTGSSESLPIPDNSVDYVFVDPPFGKNFYYADLNYIIESWHRVLTNDVHDAIQSESPVNPRSVDEYQEIMMVCFLEHFRVLKPGRWMTVEFNNSSNTVWVAIQEALSYAGFVVADTRVLDKGHLSFAQLATPNSVKRDIIISAYKPSSEVVERFSLVGGSSEGAWEFVGEHLGHLPVSEGVRGEARVVRERMADRLYDRMVAYHVHRGVTVPLTAAQFYSGLEQRFPVRDDMYFLSEQVEGYERHRMTVKELIQAELFITNEQSAVQWLRQLLKRKARTYAEIQPVFFSELQAGLPEWEALPELRDLLEASFLQDDQDRWYVPDPKKTEDLEKLRTRALLKEFEVYKSGKGRLDRFRSEAVRAGFKDAWARRDFSTIMTVGRRLPDDAFVEDEALLYYYDNARRLAADA